MVLATLLAAGLALSLQTAPTIAATPPVTGPERADPTLPDARAERALATAVDLLTDRSPLRAPLRARAGSRPDATLALRDLFSALPRLDTDGRQQARRLLARPTHGADDPLGDGYRRPALRKCRGKVCVHWVPTTRDAPPNRAWVDTTLTQLNDVWRAEVGRLRYRAPVTDGRRGGNSRFDVYLKELGGRGVYGYCTPERRAPGAKWLASGYCVLDNDFARSQYGAPPRQSLRVTSAHEFFHAVQFAYDYGEDPWLMEASATWMEEQVADGVDDNRQYLRYGQLGEPARPLDAYRTQGFGQYGNWAFFEYLSSRFGTSIVRSIWNRAGEYRGAGRQYSTAAVARALAKRGGFVSAYAGFAAGNTVPARTYAEGRAWPRPAAPAATWRLTRDRPRAATTLTINHLASRSIRIDPQAGVRGRELHLTVDGPAARTDPAAYLLVKRPGKVTKRAISLDAQGRGQLALRLTRSTRSATVVLVNASTRFSCWHRSTWSCQGRARDDRQRFEVTAVARR